MKQVGIVKVLGDGYAEVEVSRRSACEGCHANIDGNCSACISFGKKEMTVRADNSFGASEGDRVILEASSGRVLTYALCVFLLPVVFGVIGYYLFSLFNYSAMPYIGAVIGFLAAFITFCIMLNKKASKRYDVKIVGFLPNGTLEM